MCKKFTNCYDCIWATDKCKNRESNQYDKFLHDIKKCNFVGEVDNSIGCSWHDIRKSIDWRNCVPRKEKYMGNISDVVLSLVFLFICTPMLIVGMGIASKVEERRNNYRKDD